MILCCALTVDELNEKNQKIEKYIYYLSQGELYAMDKLYGLIKTDVYAYALSKSQNAADAEDIMQDTFVQIYKYAGRYEPMGKPLAWVFTIVNNFARRKFELDSRTTSIDTEETGELSDGSEMEMDVVNKQFLKEIMTILSPEEQEIVVLHIVSGMKHREIAEIQNLSLATVLSKYNRAIKKMKKFVEEGSQGEL